VLTQRSTRKRLMRLQRTKSSCGPAALANALECLGIRRTEDELAVLCKQTPEGTSPKNLLAAIKTIEGTRGSVIEEGKADVALLRLLQMLYEGRPVIVAVDRWTHWAVAGGVLGFGQRVNCIDSGDNDLLKTRTLDEVIEWWSGPDGAKKPYYGVVL
jgi:hypothetical protein